MDLLNQAFDTAMDKFNPQLKPNQRTKFKEAIEKIFLEGKIPYEAIGMGVDMLEHLYAYGNGLFTSGNYDKASDVYQALIYLNPTDNRFLFALAAANHKLKNYQEAILIYIHTANMDKENPEPLYYLYDCFAELGLPHESLDALIECIKRCGVKEQNAPLKARCILIIKNLHKQIEALETAQTTQKPPSPDDKVSTKEEAAINKDFKEPPVKNRVA